MNQVDWMDRELRELRHELKQAQRALRDQRVRLDLLERENAELKELCARHGVRTSETGYDG